MPGRPLGARTTSISSQPTPLTDAGAQRLGCGFLGGEPGRETLCRFALAQAVGLLCVKIHTVEKPPAEAIHRVLNAPNLHHVDSRSGDHATKLQHGAFPAPGSPASRASRHAGRAPKRSITTARVSAPPQGQVVPKVVKRRSTPQQPSSGSRLAPINNP